jgi:hypothetical protein
MTDLTYMTHDVARWLRRYWPEALIVAVAVGGFILSVVGFDL